MGHLSKSRKHTLFLFVTPSCDKHLRELAEEHLLFGAKPKGEPCSLYAIFIKSLLPMQVSRLIHIFWNISKTSIFAPIFSEVDQKGALKILANIKPQIMDRIVEKVTDSLQNSRAVLGTAKAVPGAGTGAVNTFMVSMNESRSSPILSDGNARIAPGTASRGSSPLITMATSSTSQNGKSPNGDGSATEDTRNNKRRRHSSDSE